MSPGLRGTPAPAPVGGGFSEGLSTPALANGVIYTGTGDNFFPGTNFCPGNLYAQNASTGATLWSSPDGVWNSSPVIVDGVLYAIGGDFPSGGIPVYFGSPCKQQGGAPFSGTGYIYAFSLGPEADLYLRIRPTTTTVHQGDLITYAFPVWNLGPNNADQEVLKTQVPEGTVFDYIRISGTPGLGTCTHTPYLGAGPISIVCNENSAMAPNTTWTVRLTVKVTAPAGTVITENAATLATTPDPNLANNTATVSLTVVP